MTTPHPSAALPQETHSTGSVQLSEEWKKYIDRFIELQKNLGTRNSPFFVMRMISECCHSAKDIQEFLFLILDRYSEEFDKQLAALSAQKDAEFKKILNSGRSMYKLGLKEAQKEVIDEAVRKEREKTITDFYLEVSRLANSDERLPNAGEIHAHMDDIYQIKVSLSQPPQPKEKT